MLIRVKNTNKCTILEGGGKNLHLPAQQLIRRIKIALLSPQNFIAFSVILGAVSGCLYALFACSDGSRSAGVFNYTGYTQLLGYCTASVICSFVGVLLSQNALHSHSHHLGALFQPKAHINSKGAMLSAGFASLALPQPLPALHTALRSGNLSNIPQIIPVISTLQNLIKNAILQKFVSIGESIFARNCKKCKILCP